MDEDFNVVDIDLDNLDNADELDEDAVDELFAADDDDLLEDDDDI